jgi:ABC-type maltose transport system permease subunit
MNHAPTISMHQCLSSTTCHHRSSIHSGLYSDSPIHYSVIYSRLYHNSLPCNSLIDNSLYCTTKHHNKLYHNHGNHTKRHHNGTFFHTSKFQHQHLNFKELHLLINKCLQSIFPHTLINSLINSQCTMSQPILTINISLLLLLQEGATNPDRPLLPLLPAVATS